MIAPVTEAGIGVWLRNVCTLLKKNHEITLLTSTNVGINIPCDKIIKFPAWKFPDPLYRYMPKLKSLLKSGFFENFDIIHLHGFSHYATDFLLRNRNNFSSPLILSVHGNLQEHKLNMMRKIHDAYFLKYKNNIDHTVAVSYAEKSRLTELGFDSSQITVAYNGVNVKKIIRNPTEKIILYFGRLAPTKNIDLLIQSFSKTSIKDSKLIIAGKDFGSLNSLKKLCQKLNLDNRIIFLNEISEKEKYSLMSKASIFVHPSLSDVFSLTLLEAASSGIPCIAFDIKGINEIFSQKNSGVLISPDDQNSLTSSIDLLLSDNSLSATISDTCINVIPKKFSWNNTVDILEKIYTNFYNSE